jgi:hypothetical protein
MPIFLSFLAAALTFVTDETYKIDRSDLWRRGRFARTAQFMICHKVCTLRLSFWALAVGVEWSGG